MVLGGIADSADDVAGGIEDTVGDVASGDVVGVGENLYTANDTFLAGVLPGGAKPGGFARNFAPSGVTDAVDQAQAAGDVFFTGGYAPGGAPSGTNIGDVVADALGGGGGNGGGNSNGDEQASGLPSWLLPVGIAAAAIGVVVFGGDI